MGDAGEGGARARANLLMRLSVHVNMLETVIFMFYRFSHPKGERKPLSGEGDTAWELFEMRRCTNGSN